MTSLKHLDLKSVPCPLNVVKIKLALEKLSKNEQLIVELDIGEPEEMVLNNLKEESINSLSLEWYKSWDKNLPNWQNTPGGINIPVLLWLSNLIDCFDLEEFARSRYQLLGNGSHWFPGNNSNLLDTDVSEVQLLKVLEGHTNPKKVKKKLRTLKEKFGDKVAKRLSKK